MFRRIGNVTIAAVKDQNGRPTVAAYRAAASHRLTFIGWQWQWRVGRQDSVFVRTFSLGFLVVGVTDVSRMDWR